MKKASRPTSGTQILWASLIVLGALWVVAFAAHLGGGLITYLLMVSLAVLLIRSALTRAKAAPQARAARPTLNRSRQITENKAS